MQPHTCGPAPLTSPAALLPARILFLLTSAPPPTYHPTHHLQLIVKGLVDDQLKSNRVSQIIFLAVGGFFTFIFLALAVP